MKICAIRNQIKAPQEFIDSIFMEIQQVLAVSHMLISQRRQTHSKRKWKTNAAETRNCYRARARTARDVVRNLYKRRRRLDHTTGSDANCERK